MKKLQTYLNEKTIYIEINVYIDYRMTEVYGELLIVK